MEGDERNDGAAAGLRSDAARLDEELIELARKRGALLPRICAWQADRLMRRVWAALLSG
jgi:hypothetical protein